MSKYIIEGGKKLIGEVSIIGAKNAVLPILAATVINNNNNVIFNTPNLRDVDIMEKILLSIGCKVDRMDGVMSVDSRHISKIYIPEELVREMRSSIILMGAMISRFGEVTISYPGGCELGPRPIDLHLKALRQMGVSIEESHGHLHCKADNLTGCDIQLDYPSVGATENIMLAAVKAKGVTVIRNAAREPEILDLQNFLNSIGCKVYGAGTSIIRIDGVEKFNGAEHTVIPDRIAAGTYMVASAITGGEVILKNIEVEHIQSMIAKLREVGCQIYTNCTALKIIGPKRVKAIENVQTLPYPGFPTDMQAQMMSLLSISNGTSVINETVFENRFKHAEELIRMGANIKTVGKVAVIQGVEGLTGAKVAAKDLRGGAALILAGLIANGVTEIENIYHIERGYDDIENKLKALDAKITKI
ncbi:UDP-N-acetylglucosamine 1-carboxyvinyltransferase MurA [Gottschalkia purinilytica]|uniref:UDP-N-acetylglucosamine 1-carboxyvinyltransferase n=1 Tax=Gottschalkia purinilytica TaxID=1503 RepID=A0A0L0WEQ9_GOTPU|nr:UDP-N-acetylglucosamine 1-carboxyvinyltransferase [Gottschalkia purinilytica]KNF09920.1 UDP-N-acetylglucosamine 1-carboxyvinyltransferase MurA [Gottschalkia purinilytica]